MTAAEENRLRFMVKACRAASRNPGHVAQFCCPVCGRVALAVQLEDGTRRARCLCGLGFIEQERGRP